MDIMERHRQTGKCHMELLRLSRHIDSALRRMEAAHMTGWVDELSYIPQAINEASNTISGNAAFDVTESIRRGDVMNSNMVMAMLGVDPAKRHAAISATED